MVSAKNRKEGRWFDNNTKVTVSELMMMVGLIFLFRMRENRLSNYAGIEIPEKNLIKTGRRI